MHFIDSIGHANVRELARTVATLIEGESLPPHGCEHFDRVVMHAGALVNGQSQQQLAQLGAATCRILVEAISAQLHAERFLLQKRLQR
jgi:hypothetical protein